METSIDNQSAEQPVRKDQCGVALHSGKRCPASRFAWVQKQVEKGGTAVTTSMQVCDEHLRKRPRKVSLDADEEVSGINLDTLSESISPWHTPELGEWAEDQIDNAMQNLSSLTLQQRLVFDLLMEGKTEREIGVALDIKQQSVGQHVMLIRKKLRQDTCQKVDSTLKYGEDL